MNVLVIAPHPDDESIGCGGTICGHTARRDRVTTVFLTSGEFGLCHLPQEEAWRVREGEAEKAAGILDVASVVFLRCTDHDLGHGMKQTAAKLRPILEREQPQLIYLPHACDWHPDHRACLPIVQAALQQCRIPAPTLFTYEVLTPLSGYDRAEDITPMMQRKLQAVRAHRSQIKQLRYDRAARALNEYRGTVSRAGRYAEVFEMADGRLKTIPRVRRADPAWHRVYQTTQEIVSLIPAQDAFILVDEDQLDIGSLVAPRRCIPFLEKDGCYWGKPANDETGICEITRLRLSGATFMVFAWPAFWWLEYYSGLSRYLRSNFRSALENDRLIVFDLQRAA